MILAVVDEQSKWLEFIESDDERIALDAMKFLTQMRDGRPKQQTTEAADQCGGRKGGSDVGAFFAFGFGVRKIHSSAHFGNYFPTG
jgi:hypothetical protein